MAMKHTEILQELECPVCFNYLRPPIRICVTGHSICDACRKRLQLCPLCQKQFSWGRNVALESITHKVKIPCSFSNKGCGTMLLYDEQEEHERTCKYKGIECPQEGCSFTGMYQELISHCKTSHIARSTIRISNFINFTTGEESTSNTLIESNDRYFWLKAKIINDYVWFVVQMLGKSDEASKYKYKLVLSHGNIKISFEDTCKSIETNDKDIFNIFNSFTPSLNASRLYADNYFRQQLSIEKIGWFPNFKVTDYIGYNSVLGLIFLMDVIPLLFNIALFSKGEIDKMAYETKSSPTFFAKEGEPQPPHPLIIAFECIFVLYITGRLLIYMLLQVIKIVFGI